MQSVGSILSREAEQNMLTLGGGWVGGGPLWFCDHGDMSLSYRESMADTDFLNNREFGLIMTPSLSDWVCLRILSKTGWRYRLWRRQAWPLGISRPGLIPPPFSTCQTPKRALFMLLLESFLLLCKLIHIENLLYSPLSREGISVTSPLVKDLTASFTLNLINEDISHLIPLHLVSAFFASDSKMRKVCSSQG